MPLTKLSLNNLSNSMISIDSNSNISCVSSKSSKSSTPNSNKQNKRISYPIIDLFLVHNENALLNLHDDLMNKYNNLGFLNKSTSPHFMNLILNNIIIDDYNHYYNNNQIKNEEIIEYNEQNYDDSNYNY